MNLDNLKNYLKLNVDSPNSQGNYFSRVKCFFDEHKEFNQDNINAYLSKRLDTVSVSTFNQTTTALRHYEKMVGVEMVYPKYKKISIKEKDYLTEDEMLKELLPYYSQIFDKQYEFYSFVTKFLFYTGVRPDEMCKLQTKDIDFNKQIFIVRSPKDNEDKKVPFIKSLIPLMQKYLQNNSTFAYNIKYQRIKYIFNKLNTELRYKKKLNSYMLRHSYAHYLLDNGVPIEKLQILLGHSDLKTTMIYAKPKEKDAIDSYFKFIKPIIDIVKCPKCKSKKTEYCEEIIQNDEGIFLQYKCLKCGKIFEYKKKK